MTPGSAEHRQALIIGNGAYKGSPALKNPANDAKAMGEKLKSLGFAVTVAVDAASDAMIQAIGVFAQQLGEAHQKGLKTSCVLFYAGHGVQVDGENYLLPIDAEVRTKLDLQHRCVGLSLVLEALSAASHTSIVLLDCCRDNPLPRTLGPASRSLAAAQGLANVQAPKGCYIAYATQPHFVALDGSGDNSPFTEALLEYVDDPSKHVTDVLMDVRRAVHQKTNGQQVPWDHSALFEPFRFVSGDASKLEGLSEEDRRRVLAEEAEAREESYWQVIEKTRDVNFIHSFVAQFPNSKYRVAALARIDAIKASSQWRRVYAWLSAAAAALVLVYLGTFYLRMMSSKQQNTDILDGDIENPQYGKPGFAYSYNGCRLYCVFDRFGRPCVGFSYDFGKSPETVIDEGKTVELRCYPKYQAVFAIKTPAEANIVSELAPNLFGPRIRLAETAYPVQPDTGLIGDLLLPDEVPGTATENVERRDETLLDGKKVLRLTADSGADCLDVCTRLGASCKGFSYNRAHRCDLFKTVRGVARDDISRQRITIPGTLSGCNDIAARIEPGAQDSKPGFAYNECGVERARAK